MLIGGELRAVIRRLCCQVRDMELGLVLADVIHGGGVNPRHERGDGFPGVVGRPIVSPTNLDLQTSGCRGVRTVGQDSLDGMVVLLSIVII